MFGSGVQFSKRLAIGSPLLAQFVAIALVCFASPALAASRNIDFSGQLDYATFQKAARANETVTIRESPGGSGAAAMALARVSKVVVDGPCNSACAWSFVQNENACFTSRASFGFHAAHDPGTGARLNAATSYWLSSVRPELRGQLGGLLSSSSLIRLSASQMRRYYGDRACGAKPDVQIAVNVSHAKSKKDRVGEQRPVVLAAASARFALSSLSAVDAATTVAISLQVGPTAPDRLTTEALPQSVIAASSDAFFITPREIPRSIPAMTVAELGNIVLRDARAQTIRQATDIDPKSIASVAIADEPMKVAYDSEVLPVIDPKDDDERFRFATRYLHLTGGDKDQLPGSLANVELAMADGSDAHGSKAPGFPGPGIFVELCAIAPRLRSRGDLGRSS